jgi:hypothetical protein
MSDLVVRTRLLWNTVHSLSDLGSELDALDSRRDRVRDAWGSDDVASALDEFVGNWDDNRRRIKDSMSSLASMARATAEEIEGIEASLSASFER